MSYRDLVTGIANIADEVWGDPVTIKPYRGGSVRDRGGIDPDRPEFTTTGVLQMRSRAPRQSVRWAADVDTDHALLFIQHAHMPAYPIDDGDFVETPGPRLWRVVTCNTQAADRAELHLTPVRGIDE